MCNFLSMTVGQCFFLVCDETMGTEAKKCGERLASTSRYSLNCRWLCILRLNGSKMIVVAVIFTQLAYVYKIIQIIWNTWIHDGLLEDSKALITKNIDNTHHIIILIRTKSIFTMYFQRKTTLE